MSEGAEQLVALDALDVDLPDDDYSFGARPFGAPHTARTVTSSASPSTE
jgi:hypothetical protein